MLDNIVKRAYNVVRIKHTRKDKRMNINEIIETPGSAEKLSDAEIKKLAYGIKYFSVDAAYKVVPVGADETMRYLRNRLESIKNTRTTTEIKNSCNGTRYDEKCETCHVITDVCNTCGRCKNCHI